MSWLVFFCLDARNERYGWCVEPHIRFLWSFYLTKKANRWVNRRLSVYLSLDQFSCWSDVRKRETRLKMCSFVRTDCFISCFFILCCFDLLSCESVLGLRNNIKSWNCRNSFQSIVVFLSLRCRWEQLTFLVRKYCVVWRTVSYSV